METKTGTKPAPISIGEIYQKIDQYYRKSDTPQPCTSNRASELGHPCERYLVYQRLNQHEAEPVPVAKLKIFREGYIQEKAIVRLIESIGYRVYNANITFPPNQYNITGHCDGQIHDEETGAGVYFDAKSMNPMLFDKVNAISDFDLKYWMVKWKAQANIYMWLLGENLFYFLLKNKSTGEIKIIPCERDQKLIDALLKKAKRINSLVKKKKYPAGITDFNTCNYCKYLKICLPSMTNGKEGTKIVDNIEIEEAILTKEKHTEAYKEYNDANNYIKSAAKRLGEGSFILGEFFMEITKHKKKGSVVKASEYLKAKITPLKIKGKD
jgi:hypothetical protein